MKRSVNLSMKLPETSTLLTVEKRVKTQKSGASGLIFQARGSAFSLVDSVLFLGLHGKMVFGILL